jgi:hypothetical protein
MARNFGLVAKAKSLYADDIEAQTDRREWIVTFLGTSLAVLIVGAIAVLMGMAYTGLVGAAPSSSTGTNALRASEANCLCHSTIMMPAVDSAKGIGPTNQPR